MNKQKVLESFLETLESPAATRAIMLQRLDKETLTVINNHSEKVERALKCTKNNEMFKLFTQKHIYASAMIMGYLLKGQLDRAELEELYLQKD